jgi:hypothetical protein
VLPFCLKGRALDWHTCLLDDVGGIWPEVLR